MRGLRAILILMTTAAFCGAVAAGSIAEKGAEAENQVAAGDPAAAIETLDAAIAEIWDAMPLTVRKAVPVDSATGYGVYAERENTVYKTGEKVLVYVEPIGFTYGRGPLGDRLISLGVDLAILDADGDQVFGKEDLMRLELPVRYRNREFFLTLNINLETPPPGKYTGRFLLKDNHSDKTAEFEIPFEVTD